MKTPLFSYITIFLPIAVLHFLIYNVSCNRNLHFLNYLYYHFSIHFVRPYINLTIHEDTLSIIGHPQNFPFLQIPTWNAVKPTYDVHNMNGESVVTASELANEITTFGENISLISNVFFLYEGTYLLNNTMYYRESHCTFHAFHHKSYLGRNYSITLVPSVILSGNTQHFNYGHSLHDLMSPYAASPRHLIENNLVVTLAWGSAYVTEMLKVVGFHRDQIHYLNENPFSFAFNLYLIEPEFCHGTLIYNYQMLYKLFVDHFTLQDLPSNRYLLINRQSPIRNISNFEEVQAWCRADFPSILWETYLGSNKLSQQVRTFMMTHFFFAIHGADLANNVFMKPGSVCCEVLPELPMMNYVRSALATHKVSVVAQNKSIGWRRVTVNYIERSFVKEIIEIGVRLLT